jgi:hypothetical protein
VSTCAIGSRLLRWRTDKAPESQNDVYTGLIGQGAGPFNLTKDYQADALATARERAALAGIRLAALINAAFKFPQ